MALVIFCVALVEAMRTRMSLSDAILRSPRRSACGWTATLSYRHARACPGHPRLHLHAVTRGWPGLQMRRRASRSSPAMTVFLREALRVAFDHRLQLGSGIVREVAA